MDLSILVVTQFKPWSQPFIAAFRDQALNLGCQLVIALDTRELDRRYVDAFNVGGSMVRVIEVRSAGYIESVLEQCVAACDGRYVLRMDDDERILPAMFDWLARGDYRAEEHWKFATANTWRDPDSFIFDPPLWPDHHTRLSLKEMSGGRTMPHAGSPFGGGVEAPVVFAHDKFLVKSLDERRAIAARYDAIGQGYGTGDGLKCFSLPEECYDRFRLGRVGRGDRVACDAVVETVLPALFA